MEAGWDCSRSCVQMLVKAKLLYAQQLLWQCTTRHIALQHRTGAIAYRTHRSTRGTGANDATSLPPCSDLAIALSSSALARAVQARQARKDRMSEYHYRKAVFYVFQDLGQGRSPEARERVVAVQEEEEQ